MGRFPAATILSVLAPFLLSAVAVTMGIFVRMPWVALTALVVLQLTVVTETFRSPDSKWGIAIGWGCTLLAWGGFLLGGRWILSLDTYFMVIAWLVAGAVILAGQRISSRPLKSRWSFLGIAWGLLAALIWVAAAYHLNLRLQFLLGLLTCAGLLIVCKYLFRLPFLAVQGANTLLLLLIGLPLADLVMRPSYRLDANPQTNKHYYSYELARQNPTAFAHWWNHFVEEWRALLHKISVPDPEGVAPFLLRPNSDGKMFESQVHINSLGFRGPEIPFAKENAYRIVALGESTTFGHTINADDVPWPELLQKIIQERLQPDCPVQVINAGIPSYTIRLNVRRLAEQILPLKPDLIISYHGYNGFMWLQPALPPAHGKGPPPYEDRPLKLLADCEYRLKMIAYRHERMSGTVSTNRIPANPMETEYACAYEDLIEIAQTNHIRLVLANYSMAVNAQSPADAVTFYRAAFPNVLTQIRANEVHSHIVEQLASLHPEIRLVDTHPGLDGEHEKFIDLVHFTDEGERYFAEAMFRSIEPMLKADLRRADTDPVK